MTLDVSKRELWLLSSCMSDVIGAIKHHLKDHDVGGALEVRWDTVIFQASRQPIDVIAMRILDCLKKFEELFIRYRHIKPELMDAFLQYCVESGKDIKLLRLDNTNPEALVLSNRHVICEIQLDDFKFKYWNSDFLPMMGVTQFR